MKYYVITELDRADHNVSVLGVYTDKGKAKTELDRIANKTYDELVKDEPSTTIEPYFNNEGYFINDNDYYVYEYTLHETEVL